MAATAPVIDNKLNEIRLNLHAIRQQRHMLTQSPIFEKICQRIPCPVLVFNQNRQVVWANQMAVDLVGLSSDNLLHGSRLEDFLLNPQLVSKPEAEPFEVEDESFYLTILEDEGSQTKRMELERTFFHDLLNTAGGMQGLTGILQDATEEELPELKDSVQNMADQLVEEILSQRDLLAAEMGELNAHFCRVNSLDIVEKVINTYRSHSTTGFRQIDISPQARHFHFQSDPVLLSRVLGNMVKNALEACKAPAVVTVFCGQENGEAFFSVHNPGYIHLPDHSHVFQQSYSTKDRGRGTGTFSMKLFSEEYLGGRIGFESNAAAGTTFTVNLPIGDL